MKRVFRKTSVWSIFLLFIILSAGMFAQIGSSFQEVHLETPVVKRKMTVYPTQYSAKHITSNAIVADPKYRSLSVFNREALLANTVSTVTRNPVREVVSGPEHGTWLWTPTLNITPEYRDSIILGAKKNGINVIYMSIDSYLDIFVMDEGAEKEAKKKAFDAVVEDFIKTALENGIAVDAEAGWKNWAEAGHTYKAFAILDYVKDYNRNHEYKFRGFQYDVEPYLLDEYHTDKKEVLINFLDLVAESIARLNGTNLEFTVVIPEFFDGTNEETPNFFYHRKNGFTVDHLLSLLDRRSLSKIIIMSYRNFSRGDDGTIDVSRHEISKANSHDTKIIVAQEVGDVPPPYITFHNTSKRHFNNQLAILKNELSDEKSYGGVAIHYVNAFLELR